MFQWILVILGAALLLYAGLVALLALFQERLLYFPTRGMVDTPASAGLAYETVHFSAADGAPLTGWFVPAPNSRRVLLFFHGNGGNISYRVQSIAQF
ncbi:MAG: alpha/beta hydrolase, partial [Chloroflexi bacterium]